MPQVRFRMPDLDTGFGPHLSMQAEYVNFDRSTGVTGQRFDIEPAVSLPLRRSWGYLEPAVSARYTGYDLDDPPTADNQPDRTLYTVSLDSGLFFDRSTSWFGHAMTQTLEPRLYYLYVPFEDQDGLPVFDTSALDFAYDNLFRTNRFAGADRVGDANQLTLALSSAYLSDVDGSELFRASIGQIFYFEDREVGLPGEPVADDSSSSFLAQIEGRIGANWRYRAGLQYDPHIDEDKLRQGLVQLSYRDRERRYLGLGYRLREGLIEQTDIGILWPFSPDVSFIGRVNYSLQDSRTLEAVAGVEYGQCCWRVRAIARHFLSNDSDDYDTGVMLELELRGLARIGKNIDTYLEETMWNYQADTP
jgi:LPS-assembly protein